VLINYNGPMSGWLLAVGIFAGAFLVACLILIYIVWPLLRWLFLQHWRRTFFALACFATLIALFYAEENWRGKHEWETFKREWEAKGEKFDYASVIPPPVPDDQNFALTPIWVESMKVQLGPKNSRQWFGDKYADADGRTNFNYRLGLEIYHSDQAAMPELEKPNLGNWQKGEATDLVAWQTYYRISGFTNQPEKKVPFYYPAKAFTNGFPVAPQPQTPALDVLLALSKYDLTIEDLRQASQLPHSRFPLYSNLNHPFDTLLPHLAALKRCTQVLQLRTIAELQRGQSEKAVDDVKLMLRLTDSIRTEPFLISHLVRIAIMEYTFQPIYEGLAEHKWSDAQLVELDQALAKLDFLADYSVAMQGERACIIGAVEFLQHNRSSRNPAVFSDMVSGGIGDSENAHSLASIAAVIYHLSPSGWFDQNKLRIGQFETQWYLPLADVENRIVSPVSVQRASAAFDEEIGSVRLDPYNWFEKKFMPALARAVEKFAYTQSSVDLARVAIALERYRLAQGEYPESLDALTPQLIEKIPHDIINGQPLHYRRTDDGQFVLYSVGWNEKDDDGVVEFLGKRTERVDISQGDWVWRYPKAE
jgi:hypothetical protein